MSRSFVRWLACLMVAACVVLAAGPAAARGRRKLWFRIDVRTGQVQALSALPPTAPEPPWPAPPSDRRQLRTAEHTLELFEGDPAAGKLLWTYTVPGSAVGEVVWHVVQGNTLVFAWSERDPDRSSGFREAVQAVDLASKKVLWQRPGAAPGPPHAAGVGTGYLVVEELPEIVLLETRTGRVVRRFAMNEQLFSVASPAPGRVWIEAGEVIECVDARTARTVWRRAKQGGLRGLRAIAGSGDWIVKTSSRTYRWRAADGREVWSVPSESESRPHLIGDSLYEAMIVVESPRERARITVVERDVRTGKQVAEYLLGRYDMPFDVATADAIGAQGGWVDVEAAFTILD